MGQSWELDLIKGARKIQLPFEKVNNFIVLNVRLNNQLPLKFILDTGARYTVLTKKELINPTLVSRHRSFSIYGADRSQKFTAHLAPNMSVNVEGILARKLSILVMEEDYLLLDNLIGTNIHGIIGTDFFYQYVLEIDYQQRLLTFYDPVYFTEKEGIASTPFDFSTYKPYLDLPIRTKKDTVLYAHLLIDTGADLSLLLHPNTSDSIQLPEKFIKGRIANGLGGFIEGYLGRVEHLSLADFEFNNIITHFQDLPILSDTLETVHRHGILGSRLLSRFTLTFDFFNQQLYLKPSKNYNKDFQYDRSGLFLLASGIRLNEITVVGLIEDSPAERVGLKEGDVILRINGRLKAGLSLGVVVGILQRKPGKKIRLVIERNGQRIKKLFFLEDLV